MSKGIRRISVIGTGTLGTQIAIQAASYEYEVRAFDQDPQIFSKTLERLRGVMSQKALTISVEEWEKGAQRIRICKSLREALEHPDLVIEACPENLELKRKVFSQIDSLTPAGAILATNSSSIPISKIEGATGRPERCLNLHFYQMVYGMNIVDLMGGTQTSPEVMDACQEFVRSVGCLPLMVKKEILGFCFNSIWRAIKRQSLFMWAGGFVDFRDIDRGWMVFTQMPQGPFGLMDAVGLDIVHDIEMVYFKESEDPKDFPPEALKAKVERKELGVKTGKGFYTYPHPEYATPGFLKP